MSGPRVRSPILNSALVLSLCCIVYSCGLKKEKNRRHDDIIQVFVQGNPETLIKDTEQNSQSFITLKNKNDFNSFQRASLVIFSEKEFFKKTGEKTSTNEVEEDIGNTDIAQEKSLYSFIPLNASTFLYTDSKNKIDFEFSLGSDSILNLEKIYVQDKQYDARVLHYSLSADKTRFSFLIGLNHHNLGRVLLSSIFYKSSILPKSNTAKAHPDFKYIAGSGIKSAWKLNEKKEVVIDICPSVIKGIEEQLKELSRDSNAHSDQNTNPTTINLSSASLLAQEAIKKWQKPFDIVGLSFSLNVQFPKSCKPFSDVNQHALYWVDRYLTLPTTDVLNPGVALVDFNDRNGEIFASDILLFSSEIQKLNLPSNNNYEKIATTSQTITHEVGHFLGLDHNFEDKDSIMSYEDVYELGYYDRDAIIELYSDQLSDGSNEVDIVSQVGSTNGSL